MGLQPPQGHAGAVRTLLKPLLLRTEAPAHGCFWKHDPGTSTEQKNALGLPQVPFGLDAKRLCTTPSTPLPSTEEANCMPINGAAEQQPY